jgi:hypothetical protein
MSGIGETSVFLDAFETAPSSYKLKKLVREKVDSGSLEDEAVKEVKKQIAHDISSDIRRQVLLYGKVVIADSTVYNNFLFGEMDEDDFNILCENCNSIIIARHRPNQMIVEGLYGKDYNMRSYWSEDLQKRANVTGKEMKDLRGIEDIVPVLSVDTGEELARKFVEMDPDIKNVSDFSAFKNFMSRCDRFVSSLDHTTNYLPYGKGKGPDEFIILKRDNLWSKIKQFATVFGEGNPSILELEKLIFPKKFPIFSTIETAIKKLRESVDTNTYPDLDKDFMKELLDDFYYQDFHESIAVYGMASQHFCTSVEQAYGSPSFRLNSNYMCGIIPENFKAIINTATWKEFFEFFNNAKIAKARTDLYEALYHLSHTNTGDDTKSIIPLIRNLLGGEVFTRDGLKSEGAISYEPLENGRPTHIIDMKESIVAYNIKPQRLKSPSSSA